MKQIMKQEFDYQRDFTVATICSHSSMQIFSGAKLEGFKTLGICIGEPPKFYNAFPKGKPDEFLTVNSYTEINKFAEVLREKNCILIPHGSFVEYLGASEFEKLELPTFGNKAVLGWESDRKKERDWLSRAGVPLPREYTDPNLISGTVIVKFHGAKGGKGFFIARSKEEFQNKIAEHRESYVIQDYIVGTRYYFQFFYSPIREEGYRLSKGSLELLGIDKRIESNVDELYRLGNIDIEPTFVVTGNLPVVIRESLIQKGFEIAERTIEESIRLFGGLVGPFCLETVVTDRLEFYVFEVSARIVAGSNLYISGSPYSDLVEEKMSTGRRIAREIRIAQKLGRLEEVLS